MNAASQLVRNKNIRVLQEVELVNKQKQFRAAYFVNCFC